MKRRTAAFTKFTLVAAIAVAALIVICGPLVRFAGVPFGSVFGVLQYAVMAAAIVALLSLIALILDWRAKRGVSKAVIALLIAGAPLLFMLNLARIGSTVPPIHDITTDWTDPPQFDAVLPLRENAPNGPDYETGFTAQQREAYPDLETLIVPAAPDAAFARALEAVEGKGFDVVASDPATGMIEATATTAWFGFKDDVVIRVRAADAGGSAVDIRSKSRMGMSDLGANANRIRGLLSDIAGS